MPAMSRPDSDCVRSTTMQHVDPVAVKYFETLNRAQILYINSMRVALDPLAAVPSGSEFQLHVELRIDWTNWTTAQHTLTVHVSPQCIKKFVFMPGERAVGIPCSDKRLTTVEIKCYNDGKELRAGEAQSFVLDMRVNKATALVGSTTISCLPEDYKFYTAMRHEQQTSNFTFSCYRYEQDAPVDQVSRSDCSIRQMFQDFEAMLALPVITPSRSVCLVSAQEAERKLTECESCIQRLYSTFDSIFLDTACRELGADVQHAEEVKLAVDWTQSHTVSADTSVDALIRDTKDLYTRLSHLSNTAVNGSWLTDDAVLSLLSTRHRLAQSVRGRRTEIAEVARVRASFLCIDAIDSTLRHVCGLDTEHYRPDAVSTALETPCHRYWLEQMKANTQNSVPLHPETYADAVVILQACAASRAARPLLPHSTAIASALGYKIWQSMHLQGLAAAQDLPVAPCAHFMYKKRARVDYSRHPVVAAAAEHMGDGAAPIALLAMLVSTDVEHRIIPPKLCTHILTLLEKATAPDAAESARQEASVFLTRVLDPQLHSLAASALCAQDNIGHCLQPDLSFISAAGSGKGITGYNMQEVSSFCLEQALKLGGENRVG